MFDAELAFFIAHQDDLVKQHRGKTLIIRGNEVVGAYRTTLEAYLVGQRLYPAGSFMVQPCVPGLGAYTVTINSSLAARPAEAQ